MDWQYYKRRIFYVPEVFTQFDCYIRFAMFYKGACVNLEN